MTKQELELMDPKTDFVFKRIFGSEKNKHVLLHFLNDVLSKTGNQKLTEIILLNPYTDKNSRADKQSIFDIKAKTDDGMIIDVEMQLFNRRDNEKRATFYWSKLYNQQLEESEKYRELKKCIVINIVNFTIFKHTKRYHTAFHFREYEEHDFLLHDDAELHFIELSKINLDETPTAAGLLNWLLFLKSRNKQLWRKLAMNEPDIKQLVKTLEYLSQNSEERELYEARLKAIRDQASEVDGARREGIERGEQKKLLELVQSMLTKGLDLQLISELTELSIEEIGKIKTSLDSLKKNVENE